MWGRIFHLLFGFTCCTFSRSNGIRIYVMNGMVEVWESCYVFML